MPGSLSRQSLSINEITKFIIHYMRLSFLLTLLVPLFGGAAAPEPMRSMMERVSPGLSEKVEVEITASGKDSPDWYELSSSVDNRPLIRSNTMVGAAVGLRRYLRDSAGVQLTWDGMEAALPRRLPGVGKAERMTCRARMRYYLNYCTYSYSMAYWDWDRWEREIDWMALHGVNMPLMAEGMGQVWRGTLLRLGYPAERVDSFIAGPAFQAWWLMNNLEGWDGPAPAGHHERQADLARRIIGRMREWGMEPVLPGYGGMVPHDAGEILGIPVRDPGLWLGFVRPAAIEPTDGAFARVADIYYEELTRLYGKASYYSVDPFHEGGDTGGMDLEKCGEAIMDAMRRASPGAVWVAQGWQANPRTEMLRGLSPESVVVLDLQAENQPVWHKRPEIYSRHPWVFCMLHNFGGNEGLFGKMEAMADGYRRALAESPALAGVGMTMEGIETNPVMYELLSDMPWEEEFDLGGWLKDFAETRYGRPHPAATRAWELLARSVYACPADSVQQGTRESLMMARPCDNPRQVSAWSNSRDYYAGEDVVAAAGALLSAAPELGDNGHFIYDVVDLTRQALDEIARKTAASFGEASELGDKEAYRAASARFLRLIELQDSLLATMSRFRVGAWLEQARSRAGGDEAAAAVYERGARRQITTWGPREPAENGRLRDYSNREWSGMLRDVYAPRWKAWFEARLSSWDSDSVPRLDFFAMDDAWVNSQARYAAAPCGNPIEVARGVLAEAVALMGE